MTDSIDDLIANENHKKDIERTRNYGYKAIELIGELSEQIALYDKEGEFTNSDVNLSEYEENGKKVTKYSLEKDGSYFSIELS